MADKTAESIHSAYISMLITYCTQQKFNSMVTIRKAISNDGAELVKLFNALDQETEFMLMEPGERKLSVGEQVGIINASSNSKSKALFVASEENVIVGFLGGSGGTANKNKHSIHIAMGILAPFWGKGIGGQLLQTFIAWATENQFHRIELTVIENNTKARSLYKNTGFETEGIKRDSLKINGHYVNEHYMAKLI